MDLYAEQVGAYLFTDREPEYSVVQLSTQLFVVPSVAGNLVETHSALSQIVCILASFFTEKVDLPAHGPIFQAKLAKLSIDPDSPSFKHKRYTYLFTDLARFMTTETAKRYVARSPAVLEFFATFVSLFNGMNRNARMIGQHVEYESETWVSAFNLSMHMSKSCRSMGQAFSGKASTQEVLEALNVLFRRTWTSAGQTSGFTTLGNYANQVTPVLTEAVSVAPTSFHHPLIWLFAEVAKNVEVLSPSRLSEVGSYKSLNDWMNQTLGQVADPDTLLLVAAEQPLRGQSF
jgi:E3 ubiquitin-protein ligase UBR1